MDFEFEQPEHPHGEHRHLPENPHGLEPVRFAIYEVVSGFVLTLECENGNAITTFIDPEKGERLAAVILRSLEDRGYFEEEDEEDA